MLFRKLRDHYFAPKNENTRRFKKEMAKKLDKRAIKYCSERTENMGETIIGKNGMINLRDGELILLSSDQVVFRARIEELKASELMSLEGVILSGKDLEHGGTERTVSLIIPIFTGWSLRSKEFGSWNRQPVSEKRKNRSVF